MSQQPTHVVFLGTSGFAVPSLEALALDPAFKIDLVVTQPDKPMGRKQILTPPAVKVAAEELELRIFQPQNINLELLSALNSQFAIRNSQFLVVVSYGQILSQELLDLPAIAPVNVHASLLPRFRGASPIQHAILSGDGETGVTIQQMVKELDAGPIVAQERTVIGDRETFSVLHDRLAAMGASLLVRTLSNALHPTPQSDALATRCPKLTREDGIVDPNIITAEEIDRRVRALVPWPGVSLTVDNNVIKILVTSLEHSSESFPLPCKDGTMLYLVSVQPPGKKPMSGEAWNRGMRGKK